MRAKKRSIGNSCFYALVFMTLCGFEVKNRHIYYDRPAGNFITYGLNRNDKKQISQVKVSSLQPKNMTVADLSLEELQKTYNGKIVKWDLLAKNLTGTGSDTVSSCDIRLNVIPRGDDAFPIPVVVEAHSIPETIEDLATTEHPNVCDFWQGLKKEERITVIGEIEVAAITPKISIKDKPELDIRPIVIETSDSYYINNNLSSYMIDELLKTEFNKKSEKR